MAEKFSSSSKDILALIKHIRAKYYSAFKHAKIITLMRNGKWSKYGTISRVSEAQRKAGIDADYILTLSATAWESFHTKQKKALVDHELAHMVLKETKKGTQYKLKHHDVEEFCAIVKRYGEWSPNLTRFRKAMNHKES